MLKRKVSLFIFALVAALSITAPVRANDWQFIAELYGWYASIEGESASGSDIDIETDTLIDELDFAFMGAFAVKKNKWSLSLDTIYMDVEDDTTGRLGGNIDVEVENWIVTPLIGYTVLDTDKTHLDIITGARYLYLKSEVQTDRSDLSYSDHIWDGVVGIRGEIKLGEKWFIPFYGDVGAGDSDLTWQVLSGIGYKFNKFEVIVAYRYLDWEFDDGSAVDTLDVSGPMAGFRVQF